MVTAKLISVDGLIVKIECLPENKEESSFYLTLDLENEKIIENTSGYSGDSYAIHAAHKMFTAWNNERIIPKTISAMWY